MITDSFDFGVISQSPGSITKFIDKAVEVLIKYVSKMFTIVIQRMEPLKLILDQAVTFENKYYKYVFFFHFYADKFSDTMFDNILLVQNSHVNFSDWPVHYIM